MWPVSVTRSKYPRTWSQAPTAVALTQAQMQTAPTLIRTQARPRTRARAQRRQALAPEREQAQVQMEAGAEDMGAVGGGVIAGSV